VVAAADGARRASGELATYVRRAAALSLAGRREAEARFDLGPAAAEVARRLGLVPGAGGPHGAVAEQLASLGTPSGSRLADRAAAVLAGLGVPPA
jgi:hypothetical protein